MVGRRRHRVRCARAVVRQRLVVASHQARECNAPDQSMSVLARAIAPLEIDRELQLGCSESRSREPGAAMYVAYMRSLRARLRPLRQEGTRRFP